jgi:hypothetical protein
MDSGVETIAGNLSLAYSRFAAPLESQQHTLPEPAGATLLIAALATTAGYRAPGRRWAAAEGQ